MTVKKNVLGLALLGLIFIAFSCNNVTTSSSKEGEVLSSEKVFIGDNFSTLFEALPWDMIQKIKKGDIIYTKSPALFLDFNYAISDNTFNSSCGKFVGWDRIVVTTEGEMNLLDFMKKLEAANKAATPAPAAKDSIPPKGK